MSGISDISQLSGIPQLSDMPALSEAPFNVVYLGIGVVSWVVAALKIRAWRRDPSKGLLVVFFSIASPATAFVLASPLVYRLVDRISGRGNLATLLVYLGIMGFSAAAVVLARMWTPPQDRVDARVWDGAAVESWRPVRLRLTVFALLVTAMTVLFFAGGATHPRTPLTFDTTFAPVPAIAAFLVLYQCLFAFALIDIGRVCLRHAAGLPEGPLRRGIRQLALGSFTACGYGACKLTAIGAAAAGYTGTEWLSTALGPAFAALGAILITTGFGGPALAAFVRRRRDYQALRPLWDLVYRADRRLALEAPPSAWTERLAVRDLEWRTARRGLEIRDGQLTLRPWVTPAVVPVATGIAGREGLDEADRAALIVATGLRSSVEFLHAGAPPRPREDQVPLPGLDTEPVEERAHLVRVAHLLYAPLTGEAVAGVREAAADAAADADVTADGTADGTEDMDGETGGERGA
ncbi:MAB_1171c family putative transporter [Streptomyces sp. NPDC093085]|uniref:MAB_1171c family putative transporter n=1 Tax=Streptomyces sp. NPDC093085 TaxID=3155068 RepID=UPI003447D758